MRNRSTYTPKGWPRVIPRMVAKDHPDQLVRFIKEVFSATGDYQSDRPTVLTIGDSILMISEAGLRPATPAFLYIYVPDADLTYRQALDAGAKSLEQPVDTPYGDRRAMVEDPWGNVWQIATAKSES